MKPLKVGMELRVTIKDHSKHTGCNPGLIEFNVYGKVLGISPDTIVLGSWCYSTNEVDDNVECFSLSRASVVKWRKM